MVKNDIDEVKKVIKKYDPKMVAIAASEMDYDETELKIAKDGLKRLLRKMPGNDQNNMKALNKAYSEVEYEVMQKEVDRIKRDLRRFEKETVLEVLGPIWRDMKCIDEDLVCNYPQIWVMHEKIPFEEILQLKEKGEGMVIKARQNIISPVNKPICVDRNISCFLRIGCLMRSVGCFWDIGCGFQIDSPDYCIERIHCSYDQIHVMGTGKCIYPVDCSGSSILVMDSCDNKVIVCDIGDKIDAVKAIEKIALEDPILAKRVSKMVEEMKKSNEL